MKKLLSAIVPAGILAMATLASLPAQAFPVGDGSSVQDLISVLDEIDSLDDLNFGDHSRSDFEFSANIEQSIANIPSVLNTEDLQNYYNSEIAGSGGGYDEDSWIISKDGCSVDVRCVVPKIGVPLALSCYGKVGLDPDELAKCLQDNDPAKFQAATACTFGNCPDFAALPSQLVATSTCQYAENPTLAGNVLLNDPASLGQTATKPLPVDLLFQG